MSDYLSVDWAVALSASPRQCQMSQSGNRGIVSGELGIGLCRILQCLILPSRGLAGTGTSVGRWHGQSGNSARPRATGRSQETLTKLVELTMSVLLPMCYRANQLLETLSVSARFHVMRSSQTRLPSPAICVDHGTLCRVDVHDLLTVAILAHRGYLLHSHHYLLY